MSMFLMPESMDNFGTSGLGTNFSVKLASGGLTNGLLLLLFVRLDLIIGLILNGNSVVVVVVVVVDVEMLLEAVVVVIGDST